MKLKIIVPFHILAVSYCKALYLQYLFVPSPQEILFQSKKAPKSKLHYFLLISIHTISWDGRFPPSNVRNSRAPLGNWNTMRIQNTKCNPGQAKAVEIRFDKIQLNWVWNKNKNNGTRKAETSRFLVWFGLFSVTVWAWWSEKRNRFLISFHKIFPFNPIFNSGLPSHNFVQSEVLPSFFRTRTRGGRGMVLSSVFCHGSCDIHFSFNFPCELSQVEREDRAKPSQAPERIANFYLVLILIHFTYIT